MRLRPIDQTQKHALIAALEKCDWNVCNAAAALGIGSATAYRWVKRYRINVQLRREASQMSSEDRTSGYDLTQEGDRRKVDVGSLDLEELRREITESSMPLSAAAEIAARAGVAAEHQEFMKEMAIRGLEMLIKGAKKAIG